MESYSLDKTDRRLLTELDRNCRVSNARLAKKAHKSREAVKYRIRRLVESGVITGFRAAINPHRAGFRLYKIYLQLRNIPTERDKLLADLRASGLIYWMGECDGNWDLIFEVYFKSDYEFYALKNRIISRYGNLVVNHDGDGIVDVYQFPKNYFSGTIHPPVVWAGDIVQNQLDETDQAILTCLVNDARMPIVEIAKKTHAAPATAKKRIERLEHLGIIIQYRISVDLNRLGLEMYKTILHLDRYTEKDERELLAYLSEIPNTNYLIRNHWNIEPEFVVENYSEYGRILDGLRARFPQVIRNAETILLKTDEWTPAFRGFDKQGLASSSQ